MPPTLVSYTHSTAPRCAMRFRRRDHRRCDRRGQILAIRCPFRFPFPPRAPRLHLETASFAAFSCTGRFPPCVFSIHGSAHSHIHSCFCVTLACGPNASMMRSSLVGLAASSYSSLKNLHSAVRKGASAASRASLTSAALVLISHKPLVVCDDMPSKVMTQWPASSREEGT